VNFDRVYGVRIVYRGEWCSVANVDRFGVWLVSLERRDALPFLADLSEAESAVRAVTVSEGGAG
jgi:hypothetical protein